MFNLLVHYPANLFHYVEYVSSAARYPHPGYKKFFSRKLSTHDLSLLKKYKKTRSSVNMPLDALERAFAAPDMKTALRKCPKQLRPFFAYFNNAFSPFWAEARPELIKIRKILLKSLQPIKNKLEQDFSNIFEAKISNVPVYLIWNPKEWSGAVWADGVTLDVALKHKTKILASALMHESAHYIDYRKGLNSYGYFLRRGFGEQNSTALHEAITEIVHNNLSRKYLSITMRRGRRTQWLKRVAFYRGEIHSEVEKVLKGGQKYRDALSVIAEKCK